MSLSHKFKERRTAWTVACMHGGASEPTPVGVAARRDIGDTLPGHRVNPP